MSKSEFLICSLFLFKLSNLAFAYDYPVSPPSFAIAKPYSNRMTPGLLHFVEEKFSLAMEIAAGETHLVHLFPWPRIQGYWRIRHNKIGGSIALFDRYQFTVRDEIEFINVEDWTQGRGHWWESRLIYSLRGTISYSPFSNLVVAFGADINHGVEKIDTEAPPEFDEDHIKNTGYSTSYTVGVTVLSQRKQSLTIGYDSRVSIDLGNSNRCYLIPHLLSICLRFPVEKIDMGMTYNRRFSDYRGYDDSLRTIVTNDFSFSFSIPAGENASLYFAFYSMPLSNNISSKAFGFGFGPTLKRGFLKDMVVIYETGKLYSFELEWQFIRYGIRFRFSI